MTRRRKILCTFGALLASGLLVLAFCPKPDLYSHTDFSTAILDRNGELLRLATASDERYRLHTSIDDIAPAAIDATLLYEDQYFYQHPGFNPASLVRAAWSTYVTRDRVMGASTITMQLARLRFSLDTRTLSGKLTQIARAIQIERHYAKQEILEAYLNLAPYGGNVEGIGTAARVYFDKPATDLTLTEALALAVIPQNPADRNPVSANGYTATMEARARLFALWAAAVDVSEVEHAQFEMPLAVRAPGNLPFLAPHFAQTQLAEAEPGVRHTTLNLALQRTVEQRLTSYLQRQQRHGLHNASALLIDHRSMQVLASVGSANFFDASIQGQVDGTRAKRSPGSTLKPFVYGLALDQGHIHPGTLLMDAPTRFAAYTPENFDRGFMGPITAQDALIYSRNVPATQLLADVGHETFQNLLVDARVTGLKAPDHYGLAMILGGNELTMQELVVLYAMLANQGVARSLVTDLVSDTPSFEAPLLSPEAAFLTLDMLQANPRPDALTVHRSSGFPVAWKTGTSYAFRDAWTVGVFGPYVLAVWTGNFDGSANPALVGRTAAAPLFFEIADALIADLSPSAPAINPAMNVRKVDICAATGGLPGRYCPQTRKAWFIPGVSPIRVSDIHRPVSIDIESGLRACSLDPDTTREEIFEFWPSNIHALFRRAGIVVRRPPDWAPGCQARELGSEGIAPRITSPTPALTYHLRLDHDADSPVLLETIADADVKTVYWFVNEQFVGAAAPTETVLWSSAPGKHQVLVIDDLGRSRSQTFSVTVAP